MKLNIGCGNKHMEGWVNIDIYPGNNPDMVRDVRRGLPFSDNSISEVVMSHFLEHLENKDLYFVLYEVWRVCKHGGTVYIEVPNLNHSLKGNGALPFDTPSHFLYFTPNTFENCILKPRKMGPENWDWIPYDFDIKAVKEDGQNLKLWIVANKEGNEGLVYFGKFMPFVHY